MQNEKHHELKKEGQSTNQFNDVEYERWSGRSKGTQSVSAQWGIENFLGLSKNQQPEREDISASLTEIGE
jgi:hypothetical protein